MTGMRLVWRCVGVLLWAIAALWLFSPVGQSGDVDCGTVWSPDRSASPDEDVPEADAEYYDSESFDRDAFLAGCDVELATDRFRILVLALAGTATLVMGGPSRAFVDPDDDPGPTEPDEA